ncbi:hypothetical protein A8135_13050 [Legionella jamestowniensis]|uniref:Non-specific serine/threonine protein kinase n=1 Tax=Legionella jamestowniensis TaxID=455 RepID=A0ABX2XUD4_9GAMM|nr:hypothetical protein [Legionella jamestowniensis]OCH98083.1 hypothetical protein A8135_13050 [Legionella jamestowniensis]
MLLKPTASEAIAQKAEYLKLSTLIDQFNATQDELMKLMYLQQIDMYSKAIVDNCEKEFFKQPSKLPNYGLKEAIYAWRNQDMFHPEGKPRSEEKGLQQVLQSYGIHADASILLKAVQYATAYQQLNPEKAEKKSSQNFTEAQYSIEKFEKDRSALYELLTKRYLLLARLIKNEDGVDTQLAELCQELWEIHNDLFTLVDTSYELNEYIIEQMNLFTLSYTAIDLIQEKFEQNFDEYDFESLRGQVNNENLLFTLFTEKKKASSAEIKKDSTETGERAIQLVIRQEDRNNAANEQWLQSNVIARFFIDDYATFTKQQSNREGFSIYNPVAISQFARQGNLKQVAKNIAKEPKVIAEKAQLYFSQLSAFCVELMQLGFYHPDIKLSNFLVDNDKLLISDRKAITNNQKLLASSLRTSILFSPPEFVKFVNSSQTRISSRAAKTELDAIPFMSFQVGLALKSFLLNGRTRDHLVRVNLSTFNSANDIAYGNLVILSDALTRNIPTKRIGLDVFHTLLAPEQLMLPTEAFLKELEATAGFDPFAVNQKIKDLMQSENIEQTALDGLLKPFGKALEFLDHDVEALLLQLFKVKTVDAISYCEYADRISTLHALSADDSTDEERIASIYQAIEEGNHLLAQQSKDTLAARLLHKTINQVEKNYEPYLETIRIRKLTTAWKAQTLTAKHEKELNEIVGYLKKYLESSFEKKPQRLKTSFAEFKNASFGYLKANISSHNYNQAWFFEKVLAWLHIKSIPNRITRTDLETHPDLKITHFLLSNLSTSSSKKLLNGDDLLTPLLSFYDDSSDSYQKLKKLQEIPPVKDKPKNKSPEKKSENSASRVVATKNKTITQEEKTKDKSESSEKYGSTVIHEDTQEYGSTIIHEDTQENKEKTKGNAVTPVI